MADLRVDLCAKCFLEVIEKEGLTFAVKKAEAAWGDMVFSDNIGGPGGHALHPAHPGASHTHRGGLRRPWPPPRAR